MNKPEMNDIEKLLNRTGYAHIAFSVGSKEKADALTERLKTKIIAWLAIWIIYPKWYFNWREEGQFIVLSLVNIFG